MYQVLIADDEPVSLKHIEKLLSQLPQFTVCDIAFDGGEAYEKALLLKPDIVITDIRMPIMDGIALAEKLSESDFRPFIVIVSGYSDFTYAQSALRLGVKDYILKPVLPSDLSELMNQLAKELLKRQSFPASEPAHGFSDTKWLKDFPKMDTEEYYRHVCRYLEEHYPEALTFSSTCKILGISQAHLSMIFRKYGGESFNSCLVRIRMEHAKQLLISSKQPVIRDIAEAVGYKDQFYFSRIFRTYTGVSPTDYIRQLS